MPILWRSACAQVFFVEKLRDPHGGVKTVCTKITVLPTPYTPAALSAVVTGDASHRHWSSQTLPTSKIDIRSRYRFHCASREDVADACAMMGRVLC